MHGATSDTVVILLNLTFGRLREFSLIRFLFINQSHTGNYFF
jgi:hypothetical protein